MEHFELHGTWWLPDRPDRRVAGTLTFDEVGVQLVLYDALRAFELPEPGISLSVAPQWEIEQVIHGVSQDHERATVFDAAASLLRGPFDTVKEDYRARLVLRGCHASAGSFTEALVSFDFLDQWADTPSIHLPSDDPGTVSISLGFQELGRAEFSGGTELRLLWGADGTAGEDAVKLNRWTAFQLVAESPLSVDEVTAILVRPLHDLVVLCLGRPVRLTSLRLRPSHQDDHREGLGRAYLRLVQPPAPSRKQHIDGFAAPTLLKLADAGLSFGELLSRWSVLWPQRQEALELLLEPLYAPFIYGRHSYASTFQSAELLHKLLGFGGKDLDRPAHRDRVDAVAAVLEKADLDEETVAWARGVLQPRNDKRLTDKINDLLVAAGAVGDAVREACPDFAGRATGARIGASHGGAAQTGLELQRFWLGRVLRWVVRVVLLGEFVDDAGLIQERAVERPLFRRDVGALAESLSGVQE